MAGTGKSTTVQKISAVAGKRLYKNKIMNLNHKNLNTIFKFNILIILYTMTMVEVDQP